MLEAYFRCAITDDECQKAYVLSQNVFQSIKKNNDPDTTLKTLSWSYYGLHQPENVIIGLIKNKIIAALRICPIEMVFRGKKYNVAGLSSICVDPKFQGQGFGRELMKKCINYLDTQNYDLSFLIARKAVDNFYTKFGFIGASSYQSLNVKLNRKYLLTNKQISFGKFDEKNIKLYSQFLKYSYNDCFGTCLRSDNTWGFVIKKIQHMGLHFNEIYYKDNIFGYVIFDDEKIIELSFDNHVNANLLRQSLIPIFFKNKNLELSLPHSHKITNCFDHDDVEYYSRKCLYGGHMIRWSPNLDKKKMINISIGKFDRRKEPIFFNLSLLDQV